MIEKINSGSNLPEVIHECFLTVKPIKDQQLLRKIIISLCYRTLVYNRSSNSLINQPYHFFVQDFLWCCLKHLRWLDQGFVALEVSRFSLQRSQICPPSFQVNLVICVHHKKRQYSWASKGRGGGAKGASHYIISNSVFLAVFSWFCVIFKGLCAPPTLETPKIIATREK